MCFLKNLFKKEKKDRTFIGLRDMLKGDIVDFDMKTWEVTARHTYDWEGERTLEWQLKSSDDIIFVEVESDETDEFSLSRKIKNTEIESSVFKFISENDDAPEKITYNGKNYNLDEISSGYFYEDSRGDGDPFISYDYISSSEDEFLTIEQWGERSFEVYKGHQVFDYQFSNFLPGT